VGGSVLRNGVVADLSACGRVVLIRDNPYRPEEIAIDGRCRASGCRQRWAKWSKDINPEPEEKP
jgi:hypothetical protein